MSALRTEKHLTPSLEDYLETLYEVIRERKVARVRDVARARGVKAGSVTPAMKRLADLGLITYERREYIELTPAGERAARRVLSRHQVLTSFLTEVLQMDPQAAEADACAMEHHISDEAMDHMVRIFEFMRSCPSAETDFLQRMQGCSKVNTEQPRCAHPCEHQQGSQAPESSMSIADLTPGQSGRIRQIKVSGAIRQGLLDMGLIPDAVVRLERVAPSGDPLWIRLRGYQLSLRMSDARAVLISEAN